MSWNRRTAVAGLAVAAAGLAGDVAVGASTGALPVVAGGADGPSPTASSTDSHTPGLQTTKAPSGPASPDPHGQGPDASGPAKFGLCNAYSSGQGGTDGEKLDSVAFHALTTAAGGAGNIAAYCADATPGGNAVHGAGSSLVSTSDAAPATDHMNPAGGTHGPAANPGSNGQSHRP
jgi:hypothetical protein